MMKTQKAPSTARGRVWALPTEWVMTMYAAGLILEGSMAQGQFGAGGWVTQGSAPLGDKDWVAVGASPATAVTTYSPNTTSSSHLIPGSRLFPLIFQGDSYHYPHLSSTTGRLNPNPSKTRQKQMLLYNGEVKPKPDSACWLTQMGKEGEAEEGKEDMNVPRSKANYLIFFLSSFYYLSSPLLLLLSSSSHIPSLYALALAKRPLGGDRKSRFCDSSSCWSSKQIVYSLIPYILLVIL